MDLIAPFKILFEPIFRYHDPADDESPPNHYIIKEIANRDVIETKMKEKLSRILPGDNRVNRVGDTSFYTLTVLPANVIMSEMEEPTNYLNLNGFYDFDESIEGCQIGDNVFTLKLSVDTLLTNAADEIIHDTDLDGYIANSLRPRLDFSGTDLSKVNFNNTNYSGANFSGANLTESQFHDSKLIKANFTGAILKGTSFYKADMRKSILTEAEFQLIYRPDDDNTFTETNLRYANLAGVYFEGVNFRDADLRHADISDANFNECIVNGMLVFGAIGTGLSHSINYESGGILTDNIPIVYGDEEDEDEGEGEGEGEEGEGEEGEGEEGEGEGEEDNESDKIADELASRADIQLAKSKSPLTADEITLPQLVISSNEKISNTTSYTFDDIVKLLTPDIKNKKLSLSEMLVNNWYGISSLGNTSNAKWNTVGVHVDIDKLPHIGTVFKCIEKVPFEEGEAIVYNSVPPCTAIHNLSRQLEISKLFKVFLQIVNEKMKIEYNGITITNKQEFLEKCATLFYGFILDLLSRHNTDDDLLDSWTHVYDDENKRKMFVKHAIFHKEEGIMNHPMFNKDDNDSKDILVIMMFINELPIQVKVAWAQNYIKEFITGYDQELETFNPKKRSVNGFIASCINGNFEKILLSIRTAIVQFYPPGLGLVEETEEEKLQLLENALLGSIFKQYFDSVKDIDGLTLDGYNLFIKTSPDVKDREKYLALLENAAFIVKLESKFKEFSGGKKHNKHNHNIRKTKRKLGKITIKHNKSKKTIRKSKKTIRKSKKNNRKNKNIKYIKY